jgi:hypothetical protein
MFHTTISLARALAIGAIALLLLLPVSYAQTTGVENPEPAPTAEAPPNTDNPPPFIHDLVENSELTQEQIDQMRTDGYGWGNIKLAAELAEKISSQSAGTDNPVTFNDALNQIISDRSQNIGFGEIAAKYGLKIGDLNKPGNQGPVTKSAGANFNKPDKPERPEKAERPEKPMKPEKPEKPEMPGRGPGR